MSIGADAYSDPGFNEIFDRHCAEVKAADSSLEQLRDDLRNVRTACEPTRKSAGLESLFVALLLPAFWLVVAFFWTWNYWLLIGTATVLLLLSLRIRFARRNETREQTRLFDLHSADIARLEASITDLKARRARLRQEHDAEVEAYWATYPGYPGDWSERARKVKERDGNKCSNEKCGWPKGPVTTKTKRRQLHAHHKQPLSQGGTNDLSNLITLCSVCHRSVDESHARVSLRYRG